MNRINEIDNTIEGKEIKTYDQDHPELVVLSGRLYGEVTYVEYFDAYYLQFGDNVYYFPQKDSYQEGKNWKKKKFDSYEECLNFSQQHNIKIVMKSTVKSPFSNGLPDTRFLFPKRNTPYDPSERTDVSRIRENKHNTNMKQTIRLTESELRNMITESVRKIIKEAIVPKACAYCGNPIKQGDNYCSKCGANIQEMVNKYNAWLQQNPNVNNEPMVWGQQSQQQPMQQSQQPTSTNNNTMINNQVQQQMQRNMGLQQKMANKIRQQKMAKFN